MGPPHSCDYVFPELLYSTLLISLPFAWGSLIPRMPGLSATVLKLQWKSRASRTNGLFGEHICPLCPRIKSLIFQMPFSDLKATSVYSEGQFLNGVVLSWSLNDPPVLKLCLILVQVGKVIKKSGRGAGDIRDSLHLPDAKASFFVFNSLEHRIIPCLACWRQFSNRIYLTVPLAWSI